MRVIVAGADYAPRPHIVSWLAKAFRRLGCDVVRVSSIHDMYDDHHYVDPCFEAPTVRFDRFVDLRDVIGKTGSVDLCVMVDQSEPWVVVNDGSAPYAYVWREGNPGEDVRAIGAANGAPVFCCMVGKGVYWPENVRFMSFAADRSFLGGRPFEAREFNLIYTGRERGAGTYNRLQRELAPSFLSDYLQGYAKYGEFLKASKSTYVVDSGRYVGSRGIEAMAAGCVVFWDGGAAFELAGLKFDFDCLKIDTVIDRATGEYVPTPDFGDRVRALCGDKDRWEALSRNATETIRKSHTFERRAETILSTLNLKAPKTADEVDAQQG